MLVHFPSAFARIIVPYPSILLAYMAWPSHENVFGQGAIDQGTPLLICPVFSLSFVLLQAGSERGASQVELQDSSSKLCLLHYPGPLIQGPGYVPMQYFGFVLQGKLSLIFFPC